MPRTLKSKSPERLPMYAANLVKVRVAKMPFKDGLYIDEFGNNWNGPMAAWYYDLYYVESGRKYDGIQRLQARTKKEAISKIKAEWHVKEVR